MAEEKKPQAPKVDLLLLAPVIVLGALLIIIAFFSGRSVFDSNSTGEIEQNEKVDLFNIYKWIGSDELKTGTSIINTKEIVVRNAPAGSIIGTQDKLKTGVVRVDPVNAYGTFWVRVDYEVAPSGWINQVDITNKIGLVRVINIFPIIYNFIKPIGYGLIIVLLLLAGYLRILLIKEEKITEKKLQIQEEAAKENTPTLKEKIAAKPDVQELPGFQTEEIVPIEVLEQQNRWQHIQDLISSYNQNDWRQAIIEADIILEEMLDKMGYKGITIGDKLKTVERSDFITLDKAWSAHKVRNQIAHDGSSFKLSRELAEKTIKDYEQVFREFYYI